MSKTFNMLLQELGGGDVANDLTGKLKALATSVQELRAGGKLVLEITMKPSDMADTGVEVLTKAKLTLPEKKPSKQLYYVSHSGDLQKNDPRQAEMEFKGPTLVASAEASIGAVAKQA